MLRGFGYFLRQLARPNYRNQLIRAEQAYMNIQNGDNYSKFREVKHNEFRHQFYIKLNGEKAFLKYKIIDEGTLDFVETFVPAAFRGTGIASKLVKAAFDHCVREDLKMKLTCAFAKKYYKDNPISGYESNVTFEE